MKPMGTPVIITDCMPLPSWEQISAFEKAHDVEFPHDFRNWLLHYNPFHGMNRYYRFYHREFNRFVDNCLNNWCFLGKPRNDNEHSCINILFHNLKEELKPLLKINVCIPIACDASDQPLLLSLDKGHNFGHVYGVDNNSPERFRHHLIAPSFCQFLELLYSEVEFDLEYYGKTSLNGSI